MVTCRRGNQFREGVEAFHVTRSSINRVILIIILFVNGPENGARAEPKPPRASLDALLALIPHQTRMDHSVRVDLEELRKGLRSKDHRTRSHAANRAAQLGPKAEPLVPSLFEAYVAEPIPYVAEEIRRALVSVGKGAVSPTAKVLRDQRKGSKARFFALQLLEDLQFDINVTDPAMREVVKDQDKTIAFHAAQFLVKPGLLKSKESWERITLCMESSVSGEPQMSDDMFLAPGAEREPFHGPVDRRAQGLGQDCAHYEKSVTFGFGMGEGIRLLEKERRSCSTRARWIAWRSLAPSSCSPASPSSHRRPSSWRTSWRHRATLTANHSRCPALIRGRPCHNSSGVGPAGPRGRVVALASCRAASASGQVHCPGRPASTACCSVRVLREPMPASIAPLYRGQ